MERWLFTSAHELGHLILHRSDYDIEQVDEQEAHEHEANVFASRFLMPEAVFLAEWDKALGLPFVDRVLKIKKMFRVSYKTVLWRLLEEGRVDEQVWSRFSQAFEEGYGRLLEAGEPEALGARAFLASQPEARLGGEPFALSKFDFLGSRLEALVQKALEQGLITWLHASDLLGLSLSEMRRLAIRWSAT